MLLIGNWKGVGTLKIMQEWITFCINHTLPHHQIIVCPQATFLLEMRRTMPKNIALGAQIIAESPIANYTSALSGTMLQSIGCKYAICHHNEYTKIAAYYESAANLFDYCIKRAHAAIAAQLIPIIYLEENCENDQKVLLYKLEEISKFSEVIIVYEPDISDVHIVKQNIDFIRKHIQHTPGKRQICYAGSLNKKNFADYTSFVDGLCFGKLSLNVQDFFDIANMVEKG